MENKWTLEKVAFNTIGYLMITSFAALCIIPFLLILSGSLTEENSILRDGYTLLPSTFSFSSYEFIFKQPAQILKSYGITIFVTLVGTIVGLFLTAMTAYVLQRKDFRFRNAFAFYFFFTTLFSGGLVPWYVLIVTYLDLKNSLLAIIMPMLLNVFYIIIMRSFMSSTIPDAISESAKLTEQVTLESLYPLSCLYPNQLLLQLACSSL